MTIEELETEWKRLSDLARALMQETGEVLSRMVTIRALIDVRREQERLEAEIARSASRG